jgi:glycosyltransferase involved in cell wall biosynthesis
VEAPRQTQDIVENSGTGYGMKICVVGLRGIPGVMGGIESHCEQIFPRLKGLCANYDISIIGRHPYISGSAREFGGLTVIPLPAARGKYLEAISNTIIAVLYARFVRHSAVVHIHGIGPALLGPLARMLGMKLIVTHHGRDFEREKWNAFAKLVLRLGERCAISASNRVIVVSKSVAEALQKRYPMLKSKIVYIPNGATEFAPSAPLDEARQALERFGLTPGNYILGVGRLVPEKGFHILIAAFKAANPKFKLLIVGKADHEDTYSRSLLAEASDTICFAGFQAHETLRTLYENASLFVLPSTHEGLPISALEAANLGVPVLLSDIQANLDIELPPVNYFPVGDTAALSAKLLMNHEFYKADRASIARRFNWGAITAATKMVYDTL